MVLTTDSGSRKARRKEQRRSKKKRPESTPDDENYESVDLSSSIGRGEESGKTQFSSKRSKSSSARSNKLVRGNSANKAQSGPTGSEDPYAHLRPDVAAAIRRDDAEIAALEAKLGLGNKKDRSRLHREYAKLEGYGEDFGDFLDDLDGLVDRVSRDGHAASSRVGYDSEADEIQEEEWESADEEVVPMKDPFEELEEVHCSPSSLDGRDIAVDNATLQSKPRDSERTSRSSSDSDDDEAHETPVSEVPDHDIVDTYRPSKGENIYGYKIDSQQDGPTPKKYMPPHLRKEAATGDDESHMQNIRLLRRSINNAMNRLSDDTLVSVAQSLSQLYSSNPKPDVNGLLWDSLRNACINKPIVMAGMIPVYAACLTGIHLWTGDSVQLGGYLLEQTIVALWQELSVARVKKEEPEQTDHIEDRDEVSKEACNLVLIVCYLYNFQIVQCNVLFDVIRRLLEKFSEVDIELLLLIMSHCGFALRSDDPTSLKEIVLAVQERALLSQKATGNMSSRVEYMISAITDLKNNKRRKHDVVLTNKSAKLRKVLGRIKSDIAADGNVRSSETCLRITLDDILNTETKGRWWKVGASWVGNQYTHCRDDNESMERQGEKSQIFAAVATTGEDNDRLLQLASKYRMNSESKRSIFCIIMGSTDIDDAFEKLVRAGVLKARVERDTVRVLMECCGNEKSFNPFYSYLASRICEYQPQCKFSFQLAFWDTFKQFDSCKARKVANLAKLLYNLVAKHDCLRVNVLKVIDMAPYDISENALIFLTVFFSTMFESFEDPSDVYRLLSNGIPSHQNAQSVASSQNGEGLREGLSVFFLQTLKSSPKNKKKTAFRANFKAAVKACETDTLRLME